MIADLLLAAIAVLPSDRLAMADRLFNKGRYAEAVTEYRALKGEPSVAADELLYRLAECERSLGNAEQAQALFAELYGKHPTSRHADRARLLHAMGLSDEKARAEALKALHSDRIAADVRAAALYHYGVLKNDADALERCAKAEPAGRYAPYADLRRATLLSASSDAAMRRKGVELLLGLAFGNKGDLSEEALYLAASQSYREKKYGEAGSLFRRYLKTYPSAQRAEEVRTMSVWCDFMTGRYADAAAACGEGKTDDFAYIRAACAYAGGEDEKALLLFRQYLTDFPAGRFRKDVELPVARLELKAAEGAGDHVRIIESARRCVDISKAPGDGLRLAWAYEKAGRAREAESEYRRLARDFPQSETAAEALFRLAMMDAREDRWAAAEMTLAEALATGKCGRFKGEAFYWRGIAAMRLDHGKEAVGFLREALKGELTMDERREARLLIADDAYGAGRTDEAKTAYAELVAEGACERMSAAKVLSVGKLLDGEAAKACAEYLIRSKSAEWRQAGYALLGTVEDRRQSYTAAIEAFRKCLAEKANVADAAPAALRLGTLETRSGEWDNAEKTLRKAVSLSKDDPALRGTAYLALARNSEAKGDLRQACAYATVVVTLYSDSELCAAARKILDAHAKEIR